MGSKRNILLILFFLTSIPYVYAQSGKPLVHIEGKGLLNNQIKEAVKGKLIPIYTAGGFVELSTTPAFDYALPQRYYRAYYKENALSGNAERARIQKNEGHIGQVYLKVNDEFFVDIMDRQTDTLVNRYVIKRLKLIPDIKLSYRSNTAHVSLLNGYSNKITLAPGEILSFATGSVARFENPVIEYTLVNLKTRKSTYKTGSPGFKPLKLEANTGYELRFNYALQPESTGVFYIQVKPHWYQLPIVYVIIIGVLAALSILIITLVLKNKIRSSQKEQQKMEQAAITLQSLLNPHFTFNALSSIQGLMNTGRIEEANYYLEEFSSLLRKILAKRKHIFNSLDQELEMMRTYIRLEALRFNFSWDIQISEILNPSVIEIPNLLLQPLVENSIKHGLSGLGDKGQLLIVCKEGQKKGTFIIIVKDNGKWVDKKSNSGYGLSLTAERIQAINKLRKEQAIDLVFNKQQETEAILTFHNWINN
ncbi:MAG: histidine kinase [Bacteroidota bacterium]